MLKIEEVNLLLLKNNFIFNKGLFQLWTFLDKNSCFIINNKKNRFALLQNGFSVFILVLSLQKIP